MKNYGLSRMIFKERVLYHYARMKYLILSRFTRSKEQKEFYTDLYTSHFEKSKTRFDMDYSIPAGKRCVPVCLLTSDLVLRDNIASLKKGLVRLLRELSTHKYYTIDRSFDDVIKTIETMDDTLTWSSQSTLIGMFDFEPHKRLSTKISDFELYIKQVNPSYFAVEFRICFTPEYTELLQKKIDSNIEGRKTYVTSGFSRSKKKSGGRKILSLCEYNEASQKADAIYESITSIKWQFYEQIQKYIPTVLHTMNYVPPGIIFYQINIDYWDESAKYFWHSLGFNNVESHFVNDAEKVFYSMQLSGRYGRHAFSDSVYIYHEDKIPLEAGIQNLYYQVVKKFCWDFSSSFFKFRFLNILNSIYAKKLIEYKLRLNQIKLKKSCLHRLLKLRYSFERDMDIYSRFLAEADFDNDVKRIDKLFSKKRQRYSVDHGYFTKLHASSAEVVEKRITEITKEFDSKSSVLQHLENYKHESRNRIIGYITFAITVLTLILLIFPNWSSEIATFLQEAWNWLLELIESIREGISNGGKTLIDIEQVSTQAKIP